MSRLRKRFALALVGNDIDADEATFDKKMEKGQLYWEQWYGIIQRGKPDILVLHRLKPPASKLRAPGPGAVRKVEWAPTYVQIHKHKVPGSQTSIKVKLGTQIIVRCWRYLKDRLNIN